MVQPEWHPWHHDNHEGRDVVGDDVEGQLPLEYHVNSQATVLSWQQRKLGENLDVKLDDEPDSIEEKVSHNYCKWGSVYSNLVKSDFLYIRKIDRYVSNIQLGVGQKFPEKITW